MKKSILVLGSAGQIGHHLCEYLYKKKYKVIKFDIVDKKKYDLRINNNFELIRRIKKSDYVFFLAFDVGGSRYLKKYQNSSKFILNNLKIMNNTFELLKKYKKPFLFSSSQMSNMSYSNYGVLKLLGEKITNSLNGNSVKFWNVYGIEKDLQKSHVITDFVLMALKNKKIKMLTDGAEFREFLHAEDCSKGLEVIMKKHNKLKNQNKELHLTTGKQIKIFDIAKLVKKIAKEEGINIKIIKGKKKDIVQKNKKNKYNYYLSKFWEPKIKINLGIKEIYRYYKYNSSRVKL